MASGTRQVTVEEFDRLVELPENADKLFEYIGGEISEVPSNPLNSEIASRISAEIVFFIKGKNLGHVTGEAGGYIVSGERYAPDVAFISKKRQHKLAERGYNPNPPDLAVEVLSPSDRHGTLRVKLANYLSAGTVVWLVDPEIQMVEIYIRCQKARTMGVDGILDGGDVLPGFTLPVKDIFPE